ncbi:MAG: Soluble pyridine nucleotide transhydrogenase [Hyphomicrobiaceae bacterium hypho_1]
MPEKTASSWVFKLIKALKGERGGEQATSNIKKIKKPLSEVSFRVRPDISSLMHADQFSLLGNTESKDIKDGQKSHSPSEGKITIVGMQRRASDKPQTSVIQKSAFDKFRQHNSNQSMSLETASMAVMEVFVPDIGDFENVPVVEIHVGPGSQVSPEDPLITLESDKATVDVPSPVFGIVGELKVKLGDKLSQGSPILIMEIKDVSSTDPITSSSHLALEKKSSTATSVPVTSVHKGNSDFSCEVLVLGSGPGGYSAAFKAADLGKKTILVERRKVLGGVCLNVGCIPSKALLHVTAVMDEVKTLAAHGITYSKPKIDLSSLRQHKDNVIGRLTSGLDAMAKMRKVDIITGTGTFLDPNHITVEFSDGSGRKIIHFEKAIIAAGSEPVKLPFRVKDPRIVDSTGALELRHIPKRMLVIGGGIIGLEMASVYSTLGARVDIVEMLDSLMVGADRDLVKVWEKFNSQRFNRIMLKTKITGLEARSNGISVTFEGKNAPKTPESYDLVLVAIGRTPSGNLINADKAGVAVSNSGFINVDRQMRTNVSHIFAIGDIVGQPMLAHKAVHEAHVAAEAAIGKKSFFDARQIPSVAYTDPEIAWTGITETQAKSNGISYKKAVFPWAASGRAIANGRDEGFTKLLFDKETHRCIGGGIVGTGAGDLISEICLAVEMGADSTDIGKTIHPHPTLGESIGMAAEVFEGKCTDLPPQKKQN